MASGDRTVKLWDPKAGAQSVLTVGASDAEGAQASTLRRRRRALLCHRRRRPPRRHLGPPLPRRAVGLRPRRARSAVRRVRCGPHHPTALLTGGYDMSVCVSTPRRRRTRSASLRTTPNLSSAASGASSRGRRRLVRMGQHAHVGTATRSRRRRRRRCERSTAPGWTGGFREAACDPARRRSAPPQTATPPPRCGSRSLPASGRRARLARARRAPPRGATAAARAASARRAPGGRGGARAQARRRCARRGRAAAADAADRRAGGAGSVACEVTPPARRLGLHGMASTPRLLRRAPAPSATAWRPTASDATGSVMGVVGVVLHGKELLEPQTLNQRMAGRRRNRSKPLRRRRASRAAWRA